MRFLRCATTVAVLCCLVGCFLSTRGAVPTESSSSDADLFVDVGIDGDVVDGNVHDGDNALDGDISDVLDARPDVELDADDDIESEFCAEGSVRCVRERIEVCSDDHWSARESCDLGCAEDEERCLELVASNVDADLLFEGSAELTVISTVIMNTVTGEIGDLEGRVFRREGTGDIDGIVFDRVDNGCLGLGVFALGALTVSGEGEIRASGDRGLVILVDGPVLLDGEIIISAVGQKPGAGGFVGGVSNEDETTGSGSVGGGSGTYFYEDYDSGGGGGGHAGRGGDGGSAGPSSEAPGGIGGEPSGREGLVPLCGGSGGGGHWGPYYLGQGSEGGAGGGAVQLTSSVEIIIDRGGAVRASGGGATSGHPTGGGGGGAGGPILLEAPSIDVEGPLVANGGGGGSGAWPEIGNAGSDGDEGGAGGAATTSGSAGGSGGRGDSLDGVPGGDHTNNGAGGGGAAGRIRLNTGSGIANIAFTPSPSLISEGIVTTR